MKDHLKIFKKLGFQEYNHPAGRGGRLFKYELEGAQLNDN